MTQMNKVIQIEKYHEGLAAGVARMWNLSRDGWGGDTRVMTEEQVKKKESNSDNIELYLALDGEEVVGYCGLSEYKEDTGSLYIPLLNVRPDYQGHKIGKKLLLQALEKTVELGWPRLDLYTWAGNTKAVPLYKKCGFFWEDRDDSTHLMNFIPQVLNTPLLKPVFEKLDWYGDSTRLIEVKPDGYKENGFTFYEYSWQNAETSARVQFERTSRGISLIENDEFILQLKIADHEVIQEEEREFEIKLVNKGAAPLSFKASGIGNERIKYDFAAEQLVVDESTISAAFTVEKGEEPSNWHTHPSIRATVWINGLECELKLGVFPINPAKIEASYSGNLSFLDKETSIDVEITNNLRENADFQLSFPENEQVVLERNMVTTHIPARGRKTVSLPLTLKKHGFYKPELTITATKMDGQKLSFKQDVSVAFKGPGAKFGGESKDFWHIFNGLGQINVRKRDLVTNVAKSKQNLPFAFLTPKLGKPYSLEFTKKKPNSVTWETHDSSVDLKICLDSAEMEGLRLTQTFRLFGEGILETWAEVENKGGSTHPDVAFSQPVHQDLEQVSFPLDGEVVYFSENRIMEIGELDPERITGNWYFSEGHFGPIGLTWSKESHAGPESWQFIIEDQFGKLEPGSKAVSGTITLSLGAFQTVDDFIAYAEQEPVLKKPERTSELSYQSDQLVIKPDSDPKFTLKTYRNSYLDGTLTIGNENHEITAEMEKTSYSVTVPITASQPLSILEAAYEGNGTEARFKELLLSPSGRVTSNCEDDSFIVDNGVITLKADPAFYPGIYSMEVNGQEWLANSYPELTAKSWWNPWAGGMKTAPRGINTFSLLKENSHAEMVEKKDCEGNTWSGLAITTEFEEHKQWKGVQYVQYYLMLPGVPVLASFAEVTVAGGKNLADDVWITDLFVGGNQLTDVKISVSDSQQGHAYHAGSEEIPLLLDGDSYFTSNCSDDKFYMISNNDAYPTDAYTNKEVLQLVSRHQGEFAKSAPLFLLFDERRLTGDLLKKLRRVQF
ncbi:GNAT family N-acetyltransferase [Mesobacillus subterraneus]|uniref:GNAT family N-acetyltransferase n=1 Tax=Mesobacillus subterraneus TaxID=285983 RepID=UPI001CFD1C41|nr:GNAT family N-acetyltransferase [Mesobacillus subterraneus]